MQKQVLEKIDFAKTHKDLYTATGKIKEVTAAKGTFLSYKGKGEPGGQAFQEGIQQMYTLAYTLKFMLKFDGKLDFAVSKLECLWHMENMENIPKSEWVWQLLVRIPDAIKATDIRKAKQEILQKKQMDTSGIERLAWNEGPCLQVMHVGPYDAVGRTYQQLDEHARQKGLIPKWGHEIYISDPRRVAPSKLKTIVRLAV